MTERRGSERRALPKGMTVLNAETNETLGTLTNLSIDGAMLVTENSVKQNSNFRGRIQLPQPLMERDEILFDLTCMWCRKNTQKGYWESGYELQVTDAYKDLISCLILLLKLEDDGRDRIPEVRRKTPTDHRESPRYELRVPLPIYDLSSHRKVGEVLDISVQGLRLASIEPIRKNTVLNCYISLPRKIFERDYLTLTAQCCWCSVIPDSMTYESGFKLVKVSKEVSAVIMHMIIHSAAARPADHEHQTTV